MYEHKILNTSSVIVVILIVVSGGAMKTKLYQTHGGYDFHPRAPQRAKSKTIFENKRNATDFKKGLLRRTYIVASPVVSKRYLLFCSYNYIKCMTLNAINNFTSEKRVCVKLSTHVCVYIYWRQIECIIIMRSLERCLLAKLPLRDHAESKSFQ